MKKSRKGRNSEPLDPHFKKFLTSQPKKERNAWKPKKKYPDAAPADKSDRPARPSADTSKRPARISISASGRPTQSHADRPARPARPYADKPERGARTERGGAPFKKAGGAPFKKGASSERRPARPYVHGAHGKDRDDDGVMDLVHDTFERKARVRTESGRDIQCEGAFDLLVQPLKRAITEQGYVTPTPVQEQTMRPLLAGKDVLACAQTGTGKTAAFTLPILNHLMVDEMTLRPRRPRALILAPTRELAAQIDASVHAYGRHLRFPHAMAFGGVSINPQISTLSRGVAVLTATPGRLLDLIKQKAVSLDAIDFFVLDEADRMLDMGFLPDVTRIIDQLPVKRQTLFFSATFTPEVTELAKKLFKTTPVEVRIAPESPTVDRIDQVVMYADPDSKMDVLTNLLGTNSWDRVLVFVRMRHSANKVAEALTKAGIKAEAIHGDKSQAARTRALSAFKAGKIKALVATDIASRGIDVERITHVVNFDMPDEAESYVHRIGRTARAGADGSAVSIVAPRDKHYLQEVEKFIKKRIPVNTEHQWHSSDAQHAKGADARPLPRRQFRSKGRK